MSTVREDHFTYSAPTVDAEMANRLISEERERIKREAERATAAGEIRLTDLQLYVLGKLLASSGRSHVYGIFLESIRDSHEWKEQAIRQAVDRLAALNLIRRVDRSDQEPSTRIEYEICDEEIARRVLYSEVRRRAAFLAQMGVSIETPDSVS